MELIKIYLFFVLGVVLLLVFLLVALMVIISILEPLLRHDVELHVPEESADDVQNLEYWIDCLGCKDRIKLTFGSGLHWCSNCTCMYNYHVKARTTEHLYVNATRLAGESQLITIDASTGVAVDWPAMDDIRSMSKERFDQEYLNQWGPDER